MYTNMHDNNILHITYCIDLDPLGDPTHHCLTGQLENQQPVQPIVPSQREYVGIRCLSLCIIIVHSPFIHMCVINIETLYCI